MDRQYSYHFMDLNFVVEHAYAHYALYNHAYFMGITHSAHLIYRLYNGKDITECTLYNRNRTKLSLLDINLKISNKHILIILSLVSTQSDFNVIHSGLW